MQAMQYGTSYGNAYGENERARSMTNNMSNTFSRTAPQRVTLRQVPMTLEQQGYPPHGPGHMARTATMPQPVSYDFTHGEPPPEMNVFRPRRYKLPELSSVPNKQDGFYPVGTRAPLKKPPHAYTLIPDPTYPVSEPVINMNGRMQSQYRCYSNDQYASASEYGKASISRRFPEKERLRYHIPGYMGHVSNQQNHHGSPYGPTTRKCIFKSELEQMSVRT